MSFPWVQPALIGCFDIRCSQYDMKRGSRNRGWIRGPAPTRGSAGILEREFQTQLNGSSASRTDDRVGGRDVGCRTAATEATRRGIVVRITILSTKRIGKVGMIENIEELRAELSTEALAKFPVLGNGEIYVTETSIAKNVATHGAEGSERRRNHVGLTIRIATECVKRIGCTNCRCLCDAGRRHVGIPWTKEWNSRGSGLEVFRVPVKIPAIVQFTRQADVRSSIHHAPRLRSIKADDRVDLPSLKQLRKTLLPRKQV